MISNIVTHLDSKVPAYKYIALFRVYLASHLIFKLLNQWSSLGLLYSDRSFVDTGIDPLFRAIGLNPILLQENYYLLTIFFLVILFLFLIGFGNNITALLVFIFLEIFQRMNHYTLNGGDNLLKFIILYYVFVNSYKYFSVHTFKMNKVSNHFLTNLFIYCILIHLCIIYFISGINKTHSDVWFNGIATYYIFSIDRFKGTSFNNQLIQNDFFVVISTYITIVWELFFCVLVWIKKLKNFVLFMGITMHIGIFIFMMLHSFEILYIATYILFFEKNYFEDKFTQIRKICLKKKTILKNKLTF